MAPERQKCTSVSSFNIKDVFVKKERGYTKYERNREDVGWDTK
jgi:hypothetical protein